MARNIRFCKMKAKFVFIGIVSLLNLVNSSTFLGGYITWRYRPSDEKVEFCYHLTWTDSGQPCDVTSLVPDNKGAWVCSEGCGLGVPLSDSSYQCTGYSTQNGWTGGGRCIQHHFPDKWPFNISFDGGSWASNTSGRMQGHLESRIDLRTRGDTNSPNRGPVTAAMPVYNLAIGCVHDIIVPVFDPDGDDITCRWASSKECGGTCDQAPNVTLDQVKCILTVPATLKNGYIQGGRYVVALTLEDHAQLDTDLDGVHVTPQHAFSMVPLQFLIATHALAGSCTSAPQFTISPPDGAQLKISMGKTWTTDIAVSGKHDITEISKTSPPRVVLTSLVKHPTSVSSKLTWVPQKDQEGHHVICLQAVDVMGMSSPQRCFFIEVIGSDLCDPSPCQNGGSCSQNENGYQCRCKDGFLGINCEVDPTLQPCEEEHQESYCICKVDGKPAKIPMTSDDGHSPLTSEDNLTKRDILGCVGGLALGWILSTAIMTLYKKIRAGWSMDSSSRKGNERRQRSWNGRSADSMTPLSPKAVNPEVLSVTPRGPGNIYHSGFGDPSRKNAGFVW